MLHSTITFVLDYLSLSKLLFTLKIYRHFAAYGKEARNLFLHWPKSVGETRSVRRFLVSVLVRLRHSPGGEVDALANGKYIADLWRYLLQAGNWAQFPIFLISNRVRRELQCKRKNRSTGVPCSTQNETVVKIKITCFPHSQPAPPQLKGVAERRRQDDFGRILFAMPQ